MTKQYRTIQGDTWDGIAYKIYGNEKYMNLLIEANPQHNNTIIFSGDVVLYVPDITVPQANNLPPWKR